MPCYYPIAAVQKYPGGPLELFNREQKHIYKGMHGRHLEVPCGQCAGCRRRRSLEWAMRCVHEAQQHKHNCYITLTYNDKNLPENNSLQHRDYVLFMKALRNKINTAIRGVVSERSLIITATEQIGKYGATPHAPIKFYMAGEYSEPNPEKGLPGGRPHYHALLFGIDFADRIKQQRSKSGEWIDTSKTLEKLWPHGYSSIGNVTFNSAAYISRYVMKKRTGDGNKIDYEILNLETGEIVTKKKEYNCMSRNPGIGKTWLDKYQEDVYTQDKVITKTGGKLRPPRYYDKQLKRLDKARYEGIKLAREIEALAHKADHTTERLAVQEIVATQKARHQQRNLPH